MYSEEQYYKALEVYEETKSATKTITILGYPARRQTLYNWINRKRIGSVKHSAQNCFGSGRNSLQGAVCRPLVFFQRAGRKGSRAAVRRLPCP